MAKARWLDDPRRAHALFGSAVGVHTGEELTLVAGPSWSAQKAEALTRKTIYVLAPEEFERRFYR